MGDGELPVAVVTGAAGAIGSAICDALSRDGFSVIGTYHRVLATPASQGRWQSRRMDVTASAEVRDFFAWLTVSTRRLDLLVNNAGICRLGEVSSTDIDVWRRVFEVNTFGVIGVIRAALPLLHTTKGSKIINVASQAGHRPEAANGPYSASKAALLSLTGTLAKELAGAGITVNSVSPGPVDTSMLTASINELARIGGLDAQDVRRGYIESTLAGRLLRPDEVAEAVAFLASASASGIAGADLPVTLGAEL